MTTPTGVVTFLFTDIEGSTRRWEADADAMRVALGAHDDVLHDAVTDCGGAVFKHTGDGMCAVFASPHAAVEAAVAAQRSLELPVRMGIATGEAEQRHGDYFGAVLNRAARVMSAGHGGQVLTDGATAELLTSVDLEALGTRRLRDITKPVQLFQVRAQGLGTEFPPLRTLDPTPGNLRPASNSFVGREAELIDVQAALAKFRLVTLIGVGGVGKTRLALETAARIAGSFPDGVWVIELASITDSDAVPEAVAAVLRITQQPELSLAESIVAALENRSRLLVFDNCEHVLDAAADLVEAILSASHAVRILATSREGLRVADEQLWPVASLDVKASAASLFIDRAAAVAPAVSLADDADAVSEICRRLDGIPLAIELAASRMQSMTVTEIRDRLDDRFRLLVGSRRGLERHQTLRHAVQWSFDLLDASEQALLQRISVFSGGFDITGVCAVSEFDDDFATLDVLDSLVRKSLVAADQSAARTRFSMLETIRQFAEDELVDSGSADETRSTHARYYAEREVDLLTQWNGPRQRDAYDWFTVELSNLRTAFRWASDQDDLDGAAAVAWYSGFLGLSVEQREAIGWAEQLVERARASGHRRLAQLYVIAAQCYTAGRVDDASRYAAEAEMAIETARFDDIPFDFEAALGGIYLALGRPELWIELCRRMLARRGRPPPGTYPTSSMVLALCIAGEFDEAMRVSRHLKDARDATDNPQWHSYALFAYAVAHRDTDPLGAYDVLLRALSIAQESGNRQSESFIAISLSRLAVSQGQPGDALDHLILAIRNRYDAGSFSLMDSPLAVLVELLEQLGHLEQAATITGVAVTPLTRAAYPEMNVAVTHLHQALGDELFERFASAGRQMTNAVMAAYALEQIDRARAELQ